MLKKKFFFFILTFPFTSQLFEHQYSQLVSWCFEPSQYQYRDGDKTGGLQKCSSFVSFCMNLHNRYHGQDQDPTPHGLICMAESDSYTSALALPLQSRCTVPVEGDTSVSSSFFFSRPSSLQLDPFLQTIIFIDNHFYRQSCSLVDILSWTIHFPSNCRFSSLQTVILSPFKMSVFLLSNCLSFLFQVVSLHPFNLSTLFPSNWQSYFFRSVSLHSLTASIQIVSSHPSKMSVFYLTNCQSNVL